MAKRARDKLAIGVRRKNRGVPGLAYWDPLWASALIAVAREHGHDGVAVNDMLRFDSAEQCKAVLAAAEAMWGQKIENWKARLEKSTAAHREKVRCSRERIAALRPLAELPPDPRPSPEELAHFRRPKDLPVFADGFARMFWRQAKLEADCNAFLVHFSTMVKDFCGYADYESYRQSALWKKIRKQVLASAEHTCIGCGERATEVHHRDYRPRVLSGEDLLPLVALCRHCHHTVHYDAQGKTRNDWHKEEAALALLAHGGPEARTRGTDGDQLDDGIVKT